MRRGTLPHWLHDRDIEAIEHLHRRRSDEENDLVLEWDELELVTLGRDEEEEG